MQPKQGRRFCQPGPCAWQVAAAQPALPSLELTVLPGAVFRMAVSASVPYGVVPWPNVSVSVVLMGHEYQKPAPPPTGLPRALYQPCVGGTGGWVWGSGWCGGLNKLSMHWPATRPTLVAGAAATMHTTYAAQQGAPYPPPTPCRRPT